MNKLCDNFKLQIQAFADGEYDEHNDSTKKLFEHLAKCTQCRKFFLSINNFNKKFHNETVFKPSNDWLKNFENKRRNKILRNIGYTLIIVPYILLFGLGIYELITDGAENMLIKVIISAIFTGFILLLVYTIKVRIKESKSDKYKEIIR